MNNAGQSFISINYLAKQKWPKEAEVSQHKQIKSFPSNEPNYSTGA